MKGLWDMGIQFLKYWFLIFTTAISLQSFGSVGFNTNDVSFLFPLKQGRPYPSISLVSTSPVLLVPSLLNEILLFEDKNRPLNELPYTGSPFLIDPAAWFVTSFRYDDCGDVMATDPISDPISNTDILKVFQIEKCQPRLRLVIQPFNSANQPIATAIHLLYKLDSEENAFVIEELASIKDLDLRADSLKESPLMIHPLLLKESKMTSTLIADKVRNLIVRALSWKGQNPSTRLQVMTMTLSAEVLLWKMVGGLVVDQHWKRFVTDFNQKFYSAENNKLLLGVETIRCNFYEFCGALPQSPYQSVQADNILTPALIENSNGLLIAPLINLETQTQAEIIDNPARTHFFNTNCISCHESSNFRNRNRLLTTHAGPMGITPFTLKNLLGDRPSTIINFGYEGMSPQVSTRVAAESALVAHRLNQSLNLLNPGKNISDVPAFWNCLMSDTDFQICLNNENNN